MTVKMSERYPHAVRRPKNDPRFAERDQCIVDAAVLVHQARSLLHRAGQLSFEVGTARDLPAFFGHEYREILDAVDKACDLFGLTAGPNADANHDLRDVLTAMPGENTAKAVWFETTTPKMERD